MAERKRVVVTGMGITCPIGNSVQEAWDNAAGGVSGIGPITHFDPYKLDNRFAGEVKNFDPEAFLGKREARRTDRVTQLALYAAKQAMEDSQLTVTEDNRYDIAVVVGTGIGGIHTIYQSVLTFLEGGARAVSPLLVPMMLPDAISSRISMQYGTRGPNFSLATACATGNNCIGEATEIIRRGQANVALAGSSEAANVELTIASFNNMTAISRRNDDPVRASRPFDKERDGFVVSAAQKSTPKFSATVTPPTPTTSPHRWRPAKARPRPWSAPSKTPAKRPLTSTTSTPTAPRPR